MCMKEVKWCSGRVALVFQKVLGSILSEVAAYSFFFPSLSGRFMVPLGLIMTFGRRRVQI